MVIPKSWTVLLLSLICLAQLARSQTITPPPLTTVTPSFTATVALWPASTASALATGVGLSDDSVGYALSYVVDLTQPHIFSVCSFPMSGIWSLLPRIVFYMTLVVALLFRTHEWIIGGALAAALTYSSLAALQVAFQVWTTQAVGEVDFVPTTGILACACILAVPLMNWSSTIRELGLDNEEKVKEDGSREVGSTRTVLVFWSLLVAVGFLSAFFGFQAYFRGYDWISIGLALGKGVDPQTGGDVGPANITCVPPLGGYFNTSAGQAPGWNNFWITRQFIEANNCQNPCDAIEQIGTLFRSVSELGLVGMATVNRWYENDNLTPKETKKIKFVLEYFHLLLFFLPFIIIQGGMHVLLFRRKSPQQARWRLYTWVAPEGDRTKSKTRRGVAFTLALLLYLFAVIVLVTAIPAFVVSIIATEIGSSFIAESETRNHVDQWGVFATVILVLIAAIICRFEPGIRAMIKEKKLATRIANLEHRIEHKNGGCAGLEGSEECKRKHSTKKSPSERSILMRILGKIWHVIELHHIWAEVSYLVRDFANLVAFEWRQFLAFWKSPSDKPPKRVLPKNLEKERKERLELRIQAWDDQKKKNRDLEAKYEALKASFGSPVDIEGQSIPAANSSSLAMKNMNTSSSVSIPSDGSHRVGLARPSSPILGVHPQMSQTSGQLHPQHLPIRDQQGKALPTVARSTYSYRTDSTEDLTPQPGNVANPWSQGSSTQPSRVPMDRFNSGSAVPLLEHIADGNASARDTRSQHQGGRF